MLSGKSWVLWAAALGCGEPPVTGHHITPMDGQTGLQPEDVLEVRSDTLDFPPGYPAPQLITVLDLTDTEAPGFVPGETQGEGSTLRFVPDAPWIDGHRYAWSVEAGVDLPHAPRTSLPEDLVGVAAFEVSDAVDVLGAGVEDAPCLVLSRDVEAPRTLEVRVDGEPLVLDVAPLPRARWSLEDLAPGLPLDASVWCLPGIPGRPGTRLTLDLGRVTTVIVRDVSPQELFLGLHRGAP